MNLQISIQADRLIEQVRNAFFHPETCLFYDYAGDGGPEERFRLLPRREEIAALDPEPCGRGTGMEDCPLHAGCMLDLACRRGDAEFARRILNGLFRLATLHGTPGFVARGLSPFAGPLCYPNSSRDQFTLAVFGAWRAARSMPEETDREHAADLLGMISDYCLRNVTPENGWNLMRRDGKRAMVSAMGPACAPHEALRLPMIHAAAGIARNEPERIATAEALLPETVARTLRMDLSRDWWDIELVQLQLSVALLEECGAFPGFARTLAEIRRRTGILARRELGILLDRAERIPVRLDVPAPDWRTCRRRLYTMSPDEGGITCTHLIFPADYLYTAEFLRGVGNLLTTLFYAGMPPTEAEMERLERILDTPELDRCHCGGLIQLTCGLGLSEKINFQP